MAQYLTIDAIVRKLLLDSGRPIHYYLQFLSYAIDGMQKLHVQTLKNINSKKLPVSSYKAVKLPCDYMDWVQVGVEVGERVRPLIQDDTINSLYNVDSTGDRVPYNTEIEAEWQDLTGYREAQFSGYEDSPVFNHRADRSDWKFKVLKERGEIQLSAEFPFEYVVLDYITDGLEADNATKVDPLASQALRRYMEWQYKVHNRNSNDSERREAERRFNDEHRHLRAAKNDLTKQDIIAAINSGYSGTYR